MGWYQRRVHGGTRFVNMVQCHFLRGFVNMQVGGILAVCVLAMAASARPDGIRIPEGLADAVGPETELTAVHSAPDELEFMKMFGMEKYLIFKISGSGRSRYIETESKGDDRSTLDDFVGKLPDKQCRFAVVDIRTKGRGGKYSSTRKLVLINVMPKDAPVREKMIYASFKEKFMKDVLDAKFIEEYLATCSDSNACFTGQNGLIADAMGFRCDALGCDSDRGDGLGCRLRPGADRNSCEYESSVERTMMDKCGGYVCEPGEEHTADWEGCC